MQEIMNVVVIDDDRTDLSSITAALAEQGISTIPIHYKGSADANLVYSSCKTAAEALPRIIITDIQMNHSGAEPTKTDLSNVARCLEEIVTHTRGPYIILAWTSIPTYFSNLKDYVTTYFKKKNIRLPIYFDSISKNDCKINGDFNANQIFEKLSNHLQQQSQINALMHWEKSVFSAAIQSVNELIEHSTDLPLNEMLFALANQVAGKNLQGHEAVAINEALIYVLKDKLSFLALDDKSKQLWADALPTVDNLKIHDIKFKLNNLLHFDYNADETLICPGDIWFINNQKEFFKSFAEDNELDSLIDTFHKIISVEDNCQLICMEISPSCDFSNNKKIFKNLILGIIVEKEKINKKDLSNIIRHESLLSMPIFFCDKAYYLIITKKHIMAATTSKVMNLQERDSEGNSIIEKKIRMRETLLISWIQAIAAHNSRIGTISFN